MKAEIFVKLSEEPEGSPRLREVLKIFNDKHHQEDEHLYSLSEIGKRVRLHPTWLNRLLVHKRCGTKIAGHRKYTDREVKEYLESEQCQERIAELRAKKKLIRKKQNKEVHNEK